MAAWERIVTYPGIARRLFGACEWNNRILISGGLSTAGAYLNDVWESIDGVQWNMLSTGANSFSARDGHIMLVHDNKIYVLGGYDGTNYYSDVWMSEDGTKWDRVSTNAFTARDQGQAFSLNGRICVVGGGQTAGGTYYNDVWGSPDGTTWNRLVNGYSRVNRTRAGFCVFNNRMHVISGYDGTTAFDTAITSADGENWEITGPTCGLPGVYDTAAAVFDNKVVITGGYTSRDAGVISSLYYSTDGEKYKVGVPNMGFSVEQHKLIALKNPNRLFCLFGYTGSAVNSDVWMSYGNWQDN